MQKEVIGVSQPIWLKWIVIIFSLLVSFVFITAFARSGKPGAIVGYAIVALFFGSIVFQTAFPSNVYLVGDAIIINRILSKKIYRYADLQQVKSNLAFGKLYFEDGGKYYFAKGPVDVLKDFFATDPNAYNKSIKEKIDSYFQGR